VFVRLDDERELPAEIVGRDPKTDVAVLKIDAKDLPVATIADSDQIKVGDIVFAIGNPMGVGLTVTSGIVSATGRAIGIYGSEGYEDFIQTDASINPGNSGGALVDIEGRLIGVNSAIMSRSGGNVGIGFAIPSNLAVNITRQLTRSGEVRRGFVGVNIAPLTADMAEAFGLKGARGVLVDSVVEGLPADKAGLKRGDIITALDGKSLDSPNGLRLAVSQKSPGSKLKVTVVRDGKKIDLDVTVGDQSNQLGSTGSELLEGVTAAPLTDELRREHGVPRRVHGLVITDVAASSDYAGSLAPGIVLIEINDEHVESLDAARKALHKGVNKVYLYTDGRVGYVALRVD
jgi:serine protease Do/serine protease DegQ